MIFPSIQLPSAHRFRYRAVCHLCLEYLGTFFGLTILWSVFYNELFDKFAGLNDEGFSIFRFRLGSSLVQTELNCLVFSEKG